MGSNYHNWWDDRKWKVAFSKLNDGHVNLSSTDVKLVSTSIETDFERSCETGYALTGMWTKYHEWEEDRNWQFHCRKVNGLRAQKTFGDKWQDHWQNEPGADLYYSSDKETFIVGVKTKWSS